MAVLLAAASLLAAPLQAQAQAVQRFSVRIQDEDAGTLTFAPGATPGSASVDFSYRNNGRGPDLKESFRVDALGAAVDYDGSGRSTLGNEIRETWTWRDGRGRWQSLVDRGDQLVPAGALYVPIEGSPAFAAQLFRSLLQRPGQTAPGVIGGDLRVERVAGMKLDDPSGAVAVSLYALTGVELTPWYLWLRDDGDKPFFADVSPWMEIVAQGYERHGAALVERQLQAQIERLQALQQRGSIERGKFADLVLVDGDPSVDISDIRKASLVIKGGTAYAPAQIFEALGVRPFVPAAIIVSLPLPPN